MRSVASKNDNSAYLHFPVMSPDPYIEYMYLNFVEFPCFLFGIVLGITHPHSTLEHSEGG